MQRLTIALHKRPLLHIIVVQWGMALRCIHSIAFQGPAFLFWFAGVPKGAVVGIYIEGKVHPCAVGVMRMSSEEIVEVNKGHGVENVHYMGDGLWQKPMLDA